MPEKNGNSAFVRVIFWTLICTSFGWTTATFFVGNKKADAIEQCSVARDIDERKERELLSKDFTRVDTNQKAVMIKLEEVVKQVNIVVTSQAVMVNNQTAILETLKEIKRDVK